MMRRWAAVGTAAVGVALLVVVAGCDPKPPPVNVAKAIDTGKGKEDELKVPAKPDASDKAGADLLKKLLDAHTGGSTDKLAPLRECTYTRRGVAEVPGGRATVEWRVNMLWPDRYRLRNELTFLATKQTTVHGLNPAGGWVQAGDGPDKTSLDPPFALTVASQKHEDSVSLLFALADPKAVVVRAKEFDTTGEKAELGLHVWTPGIGYVRLGVNEKTNLLARFAYTGREGKEDVLKDVLFHDHKEFGGVKLGSKMSVKAKGRLLAEWNELTVDFTKPDEKVFAGP